MTQQHSPLPWEVTGSLTSSGYDVYSASQRLVANCGGWHDSRHPNPDAEKKANARFIVQACNSFEELLAALELCRTVLEEIGEAHGPKTAIEAADAVIAKATRPGRARARRR